MGKIKDFFITTSAGESHTYLAGSTVEGMVIIDLIKPKVTNGPLRIILSGQAKVQWRQMSTRRDEYTIFDDISVHLWGTGSEILALGRHEFPYTFHLPDDLPSSHEDVYGHIRYTLTAILPTRKLDVIRQKAIVVHQFIDIERPDFLSQSVGSDETTLCCLCCTSAPIELTVVTDKGGYVSGETILIREYHRCRRITNISATLLRKNGYHIRNPEKSKFSYKRIVSTRNFTDTNSIHEPGSRVGRLVIPNGILPSTNCDILKVSYLVVITLVFKLLKVNNLKVSIPITIGSVQRSTTVGEIASGPISTTTAVTSAPQYTTMPNTPLPASTIQSALQPATLSSVPQYPWSEIAPIQPTPAIPSAPAYPVPNTPPVFLSPPSLNA